MKIVGELNAKAAVAVGLAFCLCSCTNKYAPKQAVYIPVKCEIELPERPYPRENQTTTERVGEILIYTEQLENDLKFCTGK